MRTVRVLPLGIVKGTSLENCKGTSLENCKGTSLENCKGTSLENCKGTSLGNCEGDFPCMFGSRVAHHVTWRSGGLAMVRYSDDKWKEVAVDLMSGMTHNQVAFKHNLGKQTIEDAIARVEETGSILPRPCGVVEGTVVRKKRKTTAKDERKVKPTIFKNRGGVLEYCVPQIQRDVGGTFLDIDRTTANKRVNEQGFHAASPARKERYTPPMMVKRVAWAVIYRAWTALQWAKMTFLDEHQLTMPSKGNSRQLSARKRSVWVHDDDEDIYLPDLCSPVPGKNTLGGTAIKCQFAILGDAFILAAVLLSGYRDRTTKPKKVPKLSKNGVRLGRKPKTKKGPKVAKPRGYDNWAHALCLQELAAAARTKLGARSCTRIMVYQDGLPLHWADAPAKVMETCRIDAHRPPECGYSPDCNPIENLFFILDDRMAKLQVAEPIHEVAAYVARAARVCEEMSKDGTVARTIATMPQRCEDIIAKKGGATKW